MSEYDKITNQQPVYNHNKVDSILNSIETIHGSNLPDNYIAITGIKGKNDFIYRYYYVLKGTLIFKKIAGDFRIMDFMSKDTFFQLLIDSLPKEKENYWLMDPGVLHKLIDLLNWMREKGFNDSALTIRNGHRHPAYNEKIGGVAGSFHMQGMAVDILVGDINRDGQTDMQDKQILLEVLDKKIIGDQGGLGLYPGSRVIHMDTRGYRARWNSY